MALPSFSWIYPSWCVKPLPELLILCVARAVADAFLAGCTGGSPEDIVHAVDSADDSGYAEALAEIVVSASVSCESAGGGRACAKAKSQAKAAAKATARGFSKAVARGLSTCECVLAGGETLFPGTCGGAPCESANDIYKAIFTESWAKGMAGLYVDLAAVAHGRVEAKVCVKGHEEAYSSAAATCVGKAGAHIVAKAVARVLLDVGCYSGAVVAEIEAFANADITVSTECDTIFEVSGDGASAFLAAEAKAIAVAVRPSHTICPCRPCEGTGADSVTSCSTAATLHPTHKLQAGLDRYSMAGVRRKLSAR